MIFPFKVTLIYCNAPLTGAFLFWNTKNTKLKTECRWGHKEQRSIYEALSVLSPVLFNAMIFWVVAQVPKNDDIKLLK